MVLSSKFLKIKVAVSMTKTKAKPKPQSVGTLTILKDGAPFGTIALHKSSTTLGRSGCEVNLDDSEVSSQHCQIQQIADGYHVFDLNSTNGTYLNGQKVLKAKLAINDLLRVGNTNFVFSVENIASMRNPQALLKSIKGIAKPDPRSEKIAAQVRDKKKKIIQSLRLVLDVTYPDMTSEKLEIEDNICVLGRTQTLGKFERDEEISRKHTSIMIDPDGKIVVQDLESTNGTFVNDEILNGPVVLNPGDVVRLGNTRVRVEVKQPKAS